MTIVLGVCAALLAVQGVAAQEMTPFRVAYIDPTTSPSASLCVADISTEARACILAGTEAATLGELSWSPDGKMIAVHRMLHPNDVNDDDDVVVVAADGGDTLPGGQSSPLTLFESRVFGTPQWSSDGRRIAALSDAGPFGSRYIAIAELDGGEEIIEMEGVSGWAYADAIAWSPDDETFAVGVFTSDGVPALVLVDADTGDSDVLVEFEGGVAGGQFNGISWSPDGTQILFTRVPSPPSVPWSGTNSEHWIVNRDGSNARKLYDSPSETGPAMEARFSPEAGTIAFDGLDANGVPQIFLVGSDGTNMRQLTHSTAGAFRPRWWPFGGTHVLYHDADTTTMTIIPTDQLNVDMTPRPLFIGHAFEWAPVQGALPANAVAPTPLPTPLSPPPGDPTPSSPPSAETPASPPLAPTGGLRPPDTGQGERSVSASREWAIAIAGLMMAATGGVLLARSRR